MKRCKRGDIWMVDLGKGIGSEQSGYRPCVIVQNDIGNTHSTTTIVCPLTTKTKPSLPTHIQIRLEECSTVLCEQIMVVDKQRLRKLIAKIDCTVLNEALKISIGL